MPPNFANGFPRGSDPTFTKDGSLRAIVRGSAYDETNPDHVDLSRRGQLEGSFEQSLASLEAKLTKARRFEPATALKAYARRRKERKSGKTPTSWDHAESELRRRYAYL